MEFKNHLTDTICAVATSPGTGAIAVIRISGEKAIEITNQLFFGKDLTKVNTHTVHFGTIRNNGRIVDEVLVTIFKNGKSYTGEDTVEISTHGSPYIQQQVINLLLENGVKLATPGEFTLRAFLNKKLDLSQAEAVADLISSKSESSHRLALQQMRGGYSNEIQSLRKELINFASLIELELDFSEEDVEFADRNQLKDLVVKLHKTLDNLISSFQLGNAIKTGVPVAIVGEPNVGKSTLLNALLNEERAIVSSIAGTTRDTIEDEFIIKGVNFRFIDTAGIRSTTDEIEIIGIQKSFEKISKATVVLLLVEATISEIDFSSIVKQIEQKINTAHQKLIVVVNKVDKEDLNSIQSKFASFKEVIFISAKEKNNIDLLKTKLFECVQLGLVSENDVVVSNSRHFEALTKSNEALLKVLEGIDKGTTSDFLAMDIRQALFQLSLITGDISSDDILDNIFKNFCIGK